MININQTDTGIYYLHEYFPVRYKRVTEEQDRIRRAIWAYKEMDSEAIGLFTNELMQAITLISKQVYPAKIGLVSVPPSKTNKESPVRKSISNITFWYSRGVTEKQFDCYKQIYDYGNLLTRKSDIPTAHEGMRATYDQQKASISCKRERLWKYRTAFFILDDVTTVGTSMDVCRDILIENGCSPNRIYRLAIARTV